MQDNQNQDNFLLFLQSHNPKKVKGERKTARDTFNISGIESKLNLPTNLIYNYIQERQYRTLGDHRDKVIVFFVGLGYNKDVSYEQFL